MTQILRPSFQSIINIVRFPYAQLAPVIYTDETYCSSIVVFNNYYKIKGRLFEPSNVLIACPLEKISAKSSISPRADTWIGLMDDIRSAYEEATRRASEKLKMDTQLIDHVLFDEHSPYGQQQVVRSGVKERDLRGISQEYKVGHTIQEQAIFFKVEDIVANLGL